MKKTICSLFFVLLLSSCDIVNNIELAKSVSADATNPFQTSSQIRKINISFSNFDESWAWVSQNIKYIRDEYNRWQAPQETVDLMSGDCEDCSVLLAKLLSNIGYSDIKIVLCKCKPLYDSGFLNCDYGLHCILYVNGKFIEPQNYDLYYDSSLIQVTKELTLDQALTICAVNGSLNIK